MNYQGTIIEESLKDKEVLEQIDIKHTEVEPVTEHHKTPWLKQWTLHSFEIPEDTAAEVADSLSKSLGDNYWYADFKNDIFHFIIFPDKVFKIDRSQPRQYEPAVAHGTNIGIPDYQLDFSPIIEDWQRSKL